jgi:hypothetical protein
MAEISIADALHAPSSRPPSHLNAHVLKFGMSSGTFTTNHLLIFYSRTGLLGSVLNMFDAIPYMNLVSWTAMVPSSVRNGSLELAHQVVCFHCHLSGTAYARTILTLLAPDWYFSPWCLGERWCADPFVWSSLLLMYAKYGCVAAAELVFFKYQGVKT